MWTQAKTNKVFKAILLGGSLAFVLGSGTVACNQNAGNTNNLVRGSLQTDGKTLFSTTDLGGQPLTFSVQNIRLGGASAYGTNPYYGYTPYTYGSMGNQSLSFDLTLNRETRNLVSSLTMNPTGGYGYMPNAYNPYAYTGAYAGGYTNFMGNQTIQMASYFQVSFSAICYQYTCDEVLLSVLIQGYNNATRQIAIRKNMREDRIVNMNEFPTFRPIEQLVREL